MVRETLSGASTILADPEGETCSSRHGPPLFRGMIGVLVVVAALDQTSPRPASVTSARPGASAPSPPAARPRAAAAAVGSQSASRRSARHRRRGGADRGVVDARGRVALVWILFGAGFTLVEVAGKTFLQRLASDEVLARVFASQETLRLAAALGSIAAPLLVAALGVEGALLAASAVMPLFAAARWAALKAFETGMRSIRGYALLRGNEIFQPLPVATLRRVCRTWSRSKSATGPR